MLLLLLLLLPLAPLQSLTGSKDLQMVSITLRVLSKPDPFKLPFIYRRLGKGE